IVVAFRHLLGLDVLSYSDPIGIAAILGLLGVIGVGVALMAATFYSARSGIDEQVGDGRDVHYEDQQRRPPDSEERAQSLHSVPNRQWYASPRSAVEPWCAGA